MIRAAHDPLRPHTATRPVLVLGLGNILLRDEGVGVHVIRELEKMNLPRDVELFDGATAGLDLVEALADRRSVIVVDACDADVEAGTVMRLQPEDLVPAGRGLSLHEAGLLEALDATRRLGLGGENVTIIGVRPYVVEWGLEMSAEMAARLPRLVDAVRQEIESVSGLQRDAVEPVRSEVR